MRKSRHRPTTPSKTKARVPASIHELSRDTLRTRLRQIEKQIRAKSDFQALSKDTQQELLNQANEIRDELQHRHQLNRRIFFISVGTLSIITLGFILFILDNKANLAQANLERAFASHNPDLIEAELERASQGISPYINPSLRRAIKDSQAHLDKLLADQTTADALLTSLKDKTRSWESLSFADMRLLSSSSFQHTAEGRAILRKWDKLAKKRKAQNISMRSETLQRVMRPLPAKSELNGNLAENLEAVRDEMEKLAKRQEEFQLLQRIHKLDHQHMARIRNRLQHLRFLSRDISTLIELEESLAEVENYEEFTLKLRSYQAHSYKLGKSVSALASKLPRESKLSDFIGLHQAKLTAEELQSLQLQLSGKSPSFNVHQPANMIQVNIMENIFQSRPLHSSYYLLYNPETKETWLITSEPTLTDDKKLKLELDPLDPRNQSGTPETLLIQPHPHMQLKTLHFTHALKDLAMNREDFFITTNLVKSLENVLSYKTGSISSLYKAYLYHTLAKMVMAHSNPMQVGLPFSQQLRKDIASLNELEKQTGIQLCDTTWLGGTEKHRRAEELYSRWFSERVGRNYLGEMSLMLRHYIHNSPEFVGFITSSGDPFFFTDVTAQDRLWFIDAHDMQLKVGDSDALSEAHSFSPLFRAHRSKSH